MSSLLPDIPLAALVSAAADEPRRGLDRIASLPLRHVQLSATQPGMRPRDLDQSARRDVLATARRRELEIAGLDLWIPPAHFAEPAHVDRAIEASVAAIELAADLGRCPVSLSLPEDADDEVIAALTAAAGRLGVMLADHALKVRSGGEGVLGVGIDPAAWIAGGDDPGDGITQHAQRLVAARLSDLDTAGMRCAVGDRGGRLDVTAYRAAIAVAGYRRAVVIDSRQWVDPWSGIVRTIDAWHASMSLP